MPAARRRLAESFAPVLKPYILFISFSFRERIWMHSPIIKAPTDTTFYFPMSMDTPGKQAATSPRKARKTSAKAAPAEAAQAAAKAPKAVKAAKVEKAEKAVKPAKAPKAAKPAKAPKVDSPAKPAEAAKAPASVAARPEEKARRAKKEKVVRDSFTMPKSEYGQLDALKERCLGAGVAAKKSELLRAGLILLAGLDDQQLLAAVAGLEAVKTGRPAKA
ncbi:hypothetical protein [Cupriavidus sp. WS]|uniref:hypothetical protein n=1 Tax=Cupriavidus sp. WS TaxID=1312922 RepID=UPI00039D7D1C